MSDEIMYLTKEGLEKLKNELKELTEVKRPFVAKRIKSARDMGDTSENAEYASAREEQAFVEGRIAELSDIIKTSKVPEGGSGEVVVGSMVTVHIEGNEEEFYIVGAPEADPINKKISHASPLGSALLGKKIGDQILVDAPIGKLSYTVLNVK